MLAEMDRQLPLNSGRPPSMAGSNGYQRFLKNTCQVYG